MSEQDFINAGLEMNEDERMRCTCGAFMEVIECINENSGEEYEAHCNRCGREERGSL